MSFLQDGPELTNTFRNDALLKKHIEQTFSGEALKPIKAHLDHCGEEAVTQWLSLSQQAEREKPVHVPFDAWGYRLDEIRLSEGWKKLEAVAAREGIVASGYERLYGDLSRVYQASLLYLFHSSSAFVSCPLAMTDGAARAIELYGDAELKGRAFKHLTSKDPQQFWTSGQWMTERSGGSDVGGTETVARKTGSGWQLEGVKWFTSATTSPMSMLLARPEGAEKGSRGLSLFYCELRDAQGKLRNIEILRLKDKLGTQALPTAELQLKGTPARLVGDEGGGVRKISSLFNITRVYNSICATSHFRRALDLAQSYSQKRVAFGRKISEHPLHRETLRQLEVDFERCFKLTFFVAHLLGKDECGTATESERILLRALTPIVKAFTAKRCMEGVSEVVEIFGGVGYCEDSGLPKLLRDAQVFSIWEGTTNVLALDFLRAVEKEGAAPVLLEFIKVKSQNQDQSRMAKIQKILDLKDRELIESQARTLIFAIAETVADLL